MPDVVTASSDISSDTDRLIAGVCVGAGAGLLAYALTRRSTVSLVALGSIPVLYRAATGGWPSMGVRPDGDTRRALAGDRGIRVRESVRLEVPIESVYAYWRQLENLPSFMSHVERVSTDGLKSHWVARGPRGLQVTWEAELINDEPNALIAWRSLPGSDITSAGSVNFTRVRGDSSTQVTVRLQYAMAGGKAANLVASLFRSAPSQTVREDLRRLKQLLEAGELAQATSGDVETAR